MSETVNEGTGGTESAPGGQDQASKDNYPKHFVDKLLGEKKKTSAENEELRKKLADIESEKLQAQGKDKELAESYKKKLLEVEQKLNKTTAQYAQNAIFAAIKTEAVKQGCVDPDALIKLANLDTVEVDPDTFTVSQEDLTRLITTMATEKSYLFKKQVASVKDANPNADSGAAVGKIEKDLTKMKATDLQKILAMKLGKK